MPLAEETEEGEAAAADNAPVSWPSLFPGGRCTWPRRVPSRQRSHLRSPGRAQSLARPGSDRLLAGLLS